MRRRIDHLAHPLDLGRPGLAAIASVGETRDRDLEEAVPGNAVVRPGDDRREQPQPRPGAERSAHLPRGEGCDRRLGHLTAVQCSDRFGLLCSHVSIRSSRERGPVAGSTACSD